LQFFSQLFAVDWGAQGVGRKQNEFIGCHFGYPDEVRGDDTTAVPAGLYLPYYNPVTE
jgi:hypothetical protein